MPHTPASGGEGRGGGGQWEGRGGGGQWEGRGGGGNGSRNGEEVRVVALA